MEEPSLSKEDERTLRFVRGLVLVLTATMIVGMVVLVVLFATRFPGSGATSAASTEFILPDTLELPEGATVQAITKGQGWWAVVTGDDRILIFDAETGALRQSVELQAQ